MKRKSHLMLAALPLFTSSAVALIRVAPPTTSTRFSARLPSPSKGGSQSALHVSSVSSWSYRSADALGVPHSFRFQDYVDLPAQELRTEVMAPTWKVFCDLDGVLVDFEAGINRVFPNEPGIHHVDDSPRRKDMWHRLEASGSFFEVLPWTECGRDLWKAIEPLKPDILTGVPFHESSRAEKYNWCKRELGIPLIHVDKAGQRFRHYHVNGAAGSSRVSSANGESKVITCWSYNKHYESGPNRVLIDDRETLREAWERKGGVFIHHDGNLASTLQKLVEHNILSLGSLRVKGLL